MYRRQNEFAFYDVHSNNFIEKKKIKNKRPINQAFPFTVIRNVGTNDC